jgi:hypothetical protein
VPFSMAQSLAGAQGNREFSPHHRDEKRAGWLREF